MSQSKVYSVRFDRPTENAIETIATDRGINGPQMIKRMIKYALDVKQSKCSHAGMEDICKTCGKDLRKQDDF
jgi:hypothetical protein